MPVSPDCLVADAAGPFVITTDGVDATPGDVISIKLADITDVTQWFLEVIGTDELSTNPVLAGVDITHEVSTPGTTVTFTCPGNLGSAFLLQSQTLGVGGPLTTTFAIFTLAENGARVGAVGEAREGSTDFGWTTKLNPLLRSAGNPLAGDVTGPADSNTLNAIQAVSIPPFSSPTDGQVFTYTDQPIGLTLNQILYDGGFLWIADAKNYSGSPSYLRRFNPTTKELLSVLVPVSDAFFLSLDTNYIYICGWENDAFVAIVSRTTMTVVGVIDTNTGLSFPSVDGIAADGTGNVWVNATNNSGASSLFKFDVSAVVASYPTPYTAAVATFTYPTFLDGLLFAYGFLWTGDQSAGAVTLKVDPLALTSTATVSPPFNNSNIASFYAAFGSIWAVNWDRIHRIDPTTLALTTVYNKDPHEGDDIMFVADDGTYLWGPGWAGDGTVYQFSTGVGTEGIVYTGTTTVNPSGTAPPTVTLSGIPNNTVGAIPGSPGQGNPGVQIQVTTPGAFGVADFQWSIDGAQTWTTGVLVASSVVLGSSGLTAHFTNATYFADNTYTSDPHILITGTTQSDDTLGIAFVPGLVGVGLPGGIWVGMDGTNDPDVVGLRHIDPTSVPATYLEPVDRATNFQLRPAPGSTPGASLSDVLTWDGAIFSPRQLTADDILPGFLISAFSGGSNVELGSTVTTPALTASYTTSPDVAPNSVVLTDSEGTSPQDVTGTPTSFASTASYTKTVYGETVTETLTATKGAVTKVATTTFTWVQLVFWAKSSSAGPYDAAFIQGLTHSVLATSRARTLSMTGGDAPGVGEKIYYAFRSAYGTPTFFIGGFEGGFELIAAAVPILNGFGVTENYDLWRSVQANLGSTTVTVA